MKAGAGSVLKKFVLCLAAAILSAPGWAAQTPIIKAERVPSPALAARNPFSAGERLSYDVSWADFIVAGEFTIQTDERRTFDGVDGYHVTAQARSVGLVSGLVLKVNDVYESFIDASTLQPFRAEKRMRHGKKQSQSSVKIDQEKRVALLEGGRKLEIPADTYDIAGLIFAIRGMDLTPGKARVLTVLEDEKLYTIKVQPEAREKITTRAGSYDTVRIATSMTRGRENDKLYNLRMYISSDARRLPVLITAEPSWGSVRVELTSAASPQPSKKPESRTQD
ncbi:MAG TPA: DUF3108 domain-containing protein [Blastocatellia bacterium]|nr:DUF3108 domain-containing protein [Blastocatellia bacterium]